MYKRTWNKEKIKWKIQKEGTLTNLSYEASIILIQKSAKDIKNQNKTKQNTTDKIYQMNTDVIILNKMLENEI